MNRKRTWRDGMQPLSTSNHNTDPSLAHQHWTAMEILVAYANLKGWVTAKAGRPDIHRAGNASKSSYFSVYFYSYFIKLYDYFISLTDVRFT